MTQTKEFIDKFTKIYKPGNRKSKLWKYTDEIKELLEKNYSYKQIYIYLRDFRQIKFKEHSVYMFIKRNKDKILNTTQPLQPIKKEEKMQQLQPSAPVQEQKPKDKSTIQPTAAEKENKKDNKSKYAIEEIEEENPLTYEEYSKDYDEAIEVLTPEQSKQTGFVFRKDAWTKISKEEFERAKWLLATKPIAFYQINKQKGVYYKTIRNLKNECIEKGHDLRRYLAYLSSLRNKRDNDPVVNSLDFFIEHVMDYGRKKR